MKTERENCVKRRKASDSSEECNPRHCSPSAHEQNQPMNRPSSEPPSSPRCSFPTAFSGSHDCRAQAKLVCVSVSLPAFPALLSVPSTIPPAIPHGG